MDYLHQIIEQQCADNPAAHALYWQNQTISYAEFAALIERIVSAIIANTQAGERIGVLALNCPAYVALMYAVPKAGRILVPLNTRLAREAHQQQIAELDINLLIGDSELIHTLKLPNAIRCISFNDAFEGWLNQHKDIPPVANQSIDTNSVAWLLFTSGTTGLPKAACLTHRSLLAGLESANAGRPVLANDKYLYPFPLFHISAHNVLHQHMHGAAVALLPAFNAADVLSSCARQGITTMSLAPTMIAMLLDHPEFDASKLSTVRTIGYGASAISAALLARVLSETDCGLSQGYGMTELSGTAAFLDADAHRMAARERTELLNTVGKVVPGVELTIVDSKGNAVANGKAGEIIIRGPQVITAYWNNPAASTGTIVDGWLYTGDIGILDDQGYLSIVDRKKDIIISGGENIASREVENVLCQFPGVRQAAVVGIPDAKWGEIVCALIEVDTEVDIEAPALIAFCKQQLAGYKAPKRIQFGVLPVNASGKLDKNQIRAAFNKTLVNADR